MSRKEWLALALFVGILFVLEGIAMRRILPAGILGAADFHSRWYGARALLVEGRDPYSQEVTAELEAIRDPKRQQLNSFSFAFPLHVIFSFLPLAYIGYDWAQIWWMVTLQWLAGALLVVMLATVGWRPKPLVAVGLALATIFFYPVARTILLGQFTLHVTVLLAFSLLLLRRGRDGWAGVLLAATSIKPQMIIVVGLWLVLWAISRQRWRFVAGVIGGGLAFLLASLALLPRWPIGFIADLGDYAAVASGKDPLLLLTEQLRPGGIPAFRYIFVASLVLGMLWAWWRGWGAEGQRFDRALYWAMAVGLLIFFQTGTTNQVILYIPLFIWFWQGLARWGRAPMLALAAVLIIGQWLFFLATIQGDYETPLMFLPLPFLVLAVLLGMEVTNRWRSVRPPMNLSTPGELS